MGERRAGVRRIGRASAATTAGVLAALLAAAPATAEGDVGSASPVPTETAATATTPADPQDATARIETATADDIAARAAEIVAGMSTRERAGTVVMGHLATRDPETARAYVADAGLGGFLLMGANVGWEEQVRELTDALAADAELPPLVAVDQEGGSVSRLYWDAAASARTLREASPGTTERAFSERGALVARAGIGVNFGIVADVTDDSSSFIWPRVLGEDVSAATSRVAAAVSGEAPFALSAVKHFPGHGTVAEDSHTTIPATDTPLATWRSRDARPFSAGISAGTPLVMTGHLSYTAVDAAPASLSAEWYRILREDLGFSGVAVTDDLGMLVQSGVPEYADVAQDAVAAIRAGADLALLVVGTTGQSAPAAADAIAAAVDSGSLDAERLTEAATRVVALRLQVAGDGRALLPCADDCTAPAG